MGQADEVRRRDQLGSVDRFNVEDVERGAGDAAIGQPFGHRVLIDDAAPCGVDQKHPRTELVEHLGGVHADGGAVAR